MTNVKRKRVRVFGADKAARDGEYTAKVSGLYDKKTGALTIDRIAIERVKRGKR